MNENDPKSENVENKLMLSAMGFTFDSVARWNLDLCERILSDEKLKEQLFKSNQPEISSIYANMIFMLHVFLEANLNNGLRMLCEKSSKKDTPPFKYVRDQLRRNQSPLQILKLLDVFFGTEVYESVNMKHGENQNCHELYRNLVAHGGRLEATALTNFGSRAETLYEPIDDLKKLVNYFTKKGISQPGKNSPSYITEVANQEIYQLFKKNISNLVQDLLSTKKNSDVIKAVLWVFDYNFFGLEYP